MKESDAAHRRPTTAGELDPLSSWEDDGAKASVLRFVARVTQAGSADFVPAEERIAVFDNDGTLWPEKPFYIHRSSRSTASVRSRRRIRSGDTRHPSKRSWKAIRSRCSLAGCGAFRIS